MLGSWLPGPVSGDELNFFVPARFHLTELMWMENKAVARHCSFDGPCSKPAKILENMKMIASGALNHRTSWRLVDSAGQQPTGVAV